METEIFRIEDSQGRRLGKIFISQNPRMDNSWVGHAVTYDLTRSDLQWTHNNYDALKIGLIQFFGDPANLRVIEEE